MIVALAVAAAATLQEASPLARVVLDGDAHGDVLAERDFLGSDPQIESERRRLLKRRGCRERQRGDHADRLRVRARNSAASGAT